MPNRNRNIHTANIREFAEDVEKKHGWCALNHRAQRMLVDPASGDHKRRTPGLGSHWRGSEALTRKQGFRVQDLLGPISRHRLQAGEVL